ncbi:MAG: hypothetical protein AAGH78_11355 [Cyanobacteria bacterium P01_H01_bin.58]
MTYSEDFVPIDDAQDLEGPSYPVVFGIEITPKVQGILLALLGIGGAAYLFTQVVQDVQTEKSEIQERVEEQREVFANQEEELERIEAVKAELEEALQQRQAVYALLGSPTSLDTLLLDSNQQVEASNTVVSDTALTNLAEVRQFLASGGATSAQVDITMVEFLQDILVSAGSGEGIEIAVSQDFLARFSNALAAEGYSAAGIEEIFFPGVRELLGTLGYTGEQISGILTPPVPFEDLQSLVDAADSETPLGQRVAPFAQASEFDLLELYFLSRFRQELSAAGFSDAAISQRLDQVLSSPLLETLLYRAELVEFSPVGLPTPVGDEFGSELNGKLERQIIQVSFRGLFDQAQGILNNVERLEPLIVIREFEQSLSDPPSGADEELVDLVGLDRRTDTSFTMEVLVPLEDPLVPPEVPTETAVDEEEEAAEE